MTNRLMDVEATLKKIGYKPKQRECLIDQMGKELHESKIGNLVYMGFNVCEVNVYDLMTDLRANLVEVGSTEKTTRKKKTSTKKTESAPKTKELPDLAADTKLEEESTNE